MSETDRAERPYREAALTIIQRVKAHPDISTAHTEWAESIIAKALAPTAAPEAPQTVGTDTRSRLIAFLATVGASTPDDHPWVQEARALADALKEPPARQPGADAELVERLRERLRFARSTHGTRVGGEPFTDRSVTVSASLIEDAIARLSAPAGEREPLFDPEHLRDILERARREESEGTLAGREMWAHDRLIHIVSTLLDGAPAGEREP